MKNAILLFDKAIEINPEAMAKAKDLRKRAEHYENLGTDEEKANQNINIFEHQQTEDNRCILCNKTFSSRTNLKRHIRLHSSDKPNRCEFCKLGYLY